MKRNITVAAIQMEIKPLAIHDNIAKAERLIRQATEASRIDLIVLPEDFLTGPIPYNLDLAIDHSSEIIQRIIDIAERHHVYLVAGSFIQRNSGRYYNTSILINPAGKVILEYKKNYLWHPEKRYLTPGTDANVVKTPIGVIGIAICWDLAHPELFARMMAQGADIICIPSYWTEEDCGALSKKYPNAMQPEAMMIDTLCAARAIETESLIVYANGGGLAKIPLKTKSITLHQVGHSQICTPIYGLVSSMKDSSEGYITYTYDRKIAKDAERVYKIREHISEPN